ncbi:threonine/serine exporter family protein [Lentilactobacillus sp. Marseille-Q4993]|uniref:threonine/serine exporter family protein n=1 Tax=Lentilactobacillus sp. Marseille-Q4993 TaxID=3039492 RepID=UPI0024BC127E|nr:threonine/serine exporter family protein [Lentilactobacillus sp. Marseille-Q4993]
MWIFIIKIICVYLSAVGFGLIINLPHKALNAAGINGVIGWLVYFTILQNFGGLASANFFGGLSVGLVSIVVARFKKMPAILFDVPGLVPLVPGGQAYNAIKNFALGNYNVAFDFLAQVIWIAGSIALGFIVAELCLKVEKRVRKITGSKPII